MPEAEPKSRTDPSLDLQKPLLVGGAGERASGWWGVCTLIATESALFGYLLLSYFYLYAQTANSWPPYGKPDVTVSGINTVILLSSSVFVWLGERCIRKKRARLGLLPLAIAIVLGITFVLVQLKEWHNSKYSPTSDLYGSLYFTITGFHMMHVVVGLVILSLLWLWTSLGYFDERRYGGFRIGGVYWHFVDAVWIFVFSTFFLVPYL